jgi:hypothetical protein
MIEVMGGGGDGRDGRWKRKEKSARKFFMQ